MRITRTRLAAAGSVKRSNNIVLLRYIVTKKITFFKMYQVLTSDILKVFVSTSLNPEVPFERKFMKNITVGDLKVSAVLFEC